MQRQQYAYSLIGKLNQDANHADKMNKTSQVQMLEDSIMSTDNSVKEQRQYATMREKASPWIKLSN